MTTITMELQGQVAFSQAIKGMTREMRAEVDRTVNQAGLLLQSDIKKRYQEGPATGRIYTHHFWTDGQGRLRLGRERSKPHQASAPGEAPQSDTGRLANSVNYKREGMMSVSVVSLLAYAQYLEYGTRGGKIKARPAWRPAVKKIGKQYQRMMAETMARVVK